MSPAFIKEIEEHFPNANITFDKFHVMKMVNEAVDQVRKAEQKEQPLLKKSKYLWLKNEENLSTDERNRFSSLKDLNLKTARAYRLKLAFQEFWNTPAIYADLYFERWYQWAIRSQLNPMVQLAKS